MNRETRQLTVGELRTNDVLFQISGVAVSYNVSSAEGISGLPMGYVERVTPGAFKQTLSAPDCDVKFLWNHDSSRVLARQKNGTLKVVDSPSKLSFVAQLDKNNPDHLGYFASVKRGDCDQMSFAFKVTSQTWDDQKKIRMVTGAELFEISCVTFPAYDEGTSATARNRQSGAGARPAPVVSDLQRAVRILREALRSDAARLIASRAFMSPLDFASATAHHLQIAGEFAEASYSAAMTARDMFNCMGPDDPDWDPDFGDTDDEDSEFCCTRSAVRSAASFADVAADKIAETRLVHSKFAAKVAGRKKGRK
jgi:HK97 family phage prohead protease